MAEIRVGENESLESALKRFKRLTAREGTLAELRKREHYEKPSVKRKKKAEAARKRKHLLHKHWHINPDILRVFMLPAYRQVNFFIFI